MKKRGSGILCHISSLPSPFGVGDLGPTAYAFADFLAETRQTYWQVLPLNPTSAAKKNSPYNSMSAFAGNVLFVSPELMREDGLLPQEGFPNFPSGAQEKLNYDEVFKFKQELFSKSYQAFRKGSAYRSEFDQFCRENSFWLENYSLYSVLRQIHEGKALCEWPKPARDRDPEELSRLHEELKEEIEREKFLQYVFFRQWHALKNYCNNKGIQIIGDFPFFMDYDSVDTWVHSAFFKLDAEKKSYAMAGSPPDSFSEQGQLFDCAVYHWDEMQRDRYTWWIARFKHLFKIFDIVRIDHFRGFIAYWEVPPEEATALNGKWEPVPYYDFMETVLRSIPSFPVIAEDLGMITPDVREAMNAYSIPGIKMLLYAFAREMREDAFLPHNHVSDCVVYTGTHDTNTCQGWFQEKDIADDKKRFLSYIGREVQSEVNWEYVRLAMMSVAKTAIIPLQDLMGLGQEARMNTPGNPEGNWLWRFKAEQITGEISKKFAEMTEIYGRS